MSVRSAATPKLLLLMLAMLLVHYSDVCPLIDCHRAMHSMLPTTATAFAHHTQQRQKQQRMGTVDAAAAAAAVTLKPKTTEQVTNGPARPAVLEKLRTQ